MGMLGVEQGVVDRLDGLLGAGWPAARAGRAVGVSARAASHRAKVLGIGLVMGRPRLVDDAKQAELRVLASSGVSRLHAAAVLGVGASAVAWWVKKLGLVWVEPVRRGRRGVKGRGDVQVDRAVVERAVVGGVPGGGADGGDGWFQRLAQGWDRGVLLAGGRLRVDEYVPVKNDDGPDGLVGGGRFLSLGEREQIAAGVRRGDSLASIGRALGRPTSTISREVNRNTNAGVEGPQGRYQPSWAHQAAAKRRRRPKVSKLAVDGPLRREVQKGLKQRLSPEQVAGRLAVDYPDDHDMRVSHETIYQALYVQARGGLKREVEHALRHGRAYRKPRRDPSKRRNRNNGMVAIAERPAEADDRAVPGHWEGDLIMGTRNNSAIGTLVERTTGFVILLHLPPNDHTAPTVAEAMINAITTLPETLKRSMTWDQGIEMANHVSITDATGMDIYFCDPHSPWQRGSNENTNGLLRQYFPKSTDLSLYTIKDLQQVADELNTRPRKRYGFHTPCEMLSHHIGLTQEIPSSVATTT